MDVFNILKPDMVNEKEVMNFYFDHMKNKFGIEEIKMYCVQDWINLSKKIYELDLNNSILPMENIIEKRRQLIITILGYYNYYRNQQAIVSLYNVDINDINILNQLNDFKKELRRKYVINTDRYYLKILNPQDINFELPLSMIDLSSIKFESIITPAFGDFNNTDYNMVFFNKIHFPDPNIELIQKELHILQENRIFDNKNIVRRIMK